MLPGYRSVQESGSALVVVPRKRSSTDPPLNVQSASYSQRDATSEGPVVQQEEGVEARSALHVSKPPPDGSLRTESRTHQLSAIDDTFFHYEPPPYPTAAPPSDYPAESLLPSLPTHPPPGAYHHPPQRAFTSEQGLPHMNTALPRSTSQISQEPFGCYFADASSESSLPSVQQSASQQLHLSHTALQVAKMALELVPGATSQETPSDQWYRTSQSSMASSLSGQLAHFSDPTTGYVSFSSDTEKRPPRLRLKKHSSCHGAETRDPTHHAIPNTRGRSFQNTSSGPRSYADERRCSTPDIPPSTRPNTNPALHYSQDAAVQKQTMEDIQYDYREDEATPQGEAVRRERADYPRSAKIVEEVQSHSSDHTPPATVDSVATPRPKLRRGVSEQSRTPRASVYSETSEGTIVSPGTSIYGKGKMDYFWH